MQLMDHLPEAVSRHCTAVMGTHDVHSDPVRYRQWLEARQQGIGSTDAAATLSLSPWSSPRALYYDKTEPVVLRDDIELFEAGRRSEDMNAQWFEDKTGLLVFNAPFMVRSNRVPFMFADPDRYCDIGGDEWGIVECKNIMAQKSHDWDDGPPLHYRLQLQHQLSVTGLSLGFFSVLVGGSKHIYVEVPRDDELIASLISAEEAFWTCVLLGRPPATDGEDVTTLAISAHFDEPIPDAMVEVDDSFLALIQRRETLKIEEKIITKRITEVENQMKDIIGEAEAAVMGKEVLATWKLQSRAAHEVKESTFRKLDVKKIKESK